MDFRFFIAASSFTEQTIAVCDGAENRSTPSQFTAFLCRIDHDDLSRLASRELLALPARFCSDEN